MDDLTDTVPRTVSPEISRFSRSVVHLITRPTYLGIDLPSTLKCAPANM